MRSTSFNLLAVLTALVALAALPRCSGDSTPINTGACNPPCEDEKVCVNSKCVARDAGVAVDGGDVIIIPGGKDAGSVNPVGRDAGLQQCTGTTSSGQQLPLDMFIMLDKSGSMACTTADPNCNNPEPNSKWDAVTAALKSFLQSDPAGVSVGIQYFGLSDTSGFCTTYANGYSKKCSTDADCGPCGPCDTTSKACNATENHETCDPAAFAKAAVDIAALPGVTAAIEASINAQTPNTSTPTAPALQGAVSYAQIWASNHPKHVVIVVFATDGEPTECNYVTWSSSGVVVDQASINAIASTGYTGSPKVLTFVIGIQDANNNLSALNGIAQAGSGGTTNAFLVGGSADVNSQFLAALNSIRGTALGCTYQIPPPPSGQTLDYTQVNVQYTPGGGATETLVYVGGQSGCASATKDAWYYDNPPPGTPTQIIMCDSTCTKVKADTGGNVNIQLGCATVIN